MTKNGILVFLFALLLSAQWVVPLWRVHRVEEVRSSGRIYRIRIQSVNPALFFNARAVPVFLQQDDVRALWKQVAVRATGKNQRLYVRLYSGGDGFARFGGVSSLPPEQADCLCLRYEDPFLGWLFQDPPPPAELQAVYEAIARPVPKDAWVQVRVMGDRMSIEQLYVGDKPIIDYLRQRTGMTGEIGE